MAAPTEAEIREAIEADWPIDVEGESPDWIWEALAPINDSDEALVRAGWVEGYAPRADHPGTLWADMTKAEVDELHGAVQDAISKAMLTFQEAALEGAIAAAVAFARAHPDVPRGRWPIAPAEDDPTPTGGEDADCCRLHVRVHALRSVVREVADEVLEERARGQASAA